MTPLRLVLATAFLALCAFRVRADDWPQWGGPRRDGVWREQGIIDKFPAAGPTIRWRTPVAAGYAGPAVADGRVYVTDRVLGRGTELPGDPWGQGKLAGVERIACLDAADGKVIWRQEYDCAYRISYAAGPRATPVVAGGRVYTMGAMGDVRCRDTVDGKLIWSAKLGAADNSTTPTWGYSASPLLDGNRLICVGGGREGIVTAFDKDSGKVLWKAVPVAQSGYCSPMIYEAGGARQLIIYHPEALVSLDPETGREYWADPMHIRYAVTVAVPVKAGDLLFTTGGNEGVRMMKLAPDKPAATRLWRRGGRSETDTDAIHGLMCTPVVKDEHIYGVCIYGQLRCIRLSDGQRVWETLAPTTGGEPAWCANAFIVPNGGRCFLPNEKGDLIIAKLSPKGYEEISRAHLLEPTNRDCGRMVVWSPPAFAGKCAFMRNDREIICVELAAK